MTNCKCHSYPICSYCVRIEEAAEKHTASEYEQYDFKEGAKFGMELMKEEYDKLASDKFSNDKDYLSLSSERNTLQSQHQKLLAVSDKLVEALEGISNESAGFINCHEDAISYDNGNSNIAVMRIRIDRAREALTQFKNEMSGMKDL